MSHVREIISFFIAPPIASARTPSRSRDDPNLAKTSSFSVRASTPRVRLLSSESSKPLLSLPAMQSSRGCLPFGRVSASSGAPFIPTIARSLRRAQNLPALATARDTAPRFYGSVRAVKVLLAPLRSTVDCAPSADGEVAIDFTQRNCRNCREKYRRGQHLPP